MKTLKLFSILLIGYLVVSSILNSCNEDDAGDKELDTKALVLEIAKAENLIENAVDINYKDGAIDTLLNHVDKAKEVLDKSKSQTEIDAAVVDLQAAIALFNNSKLNLDRELLEQRLTEAKAILDTATEGSNPGNFIVGSKAILQNQVDESDSIFTYSKDQDEIDASAAKLLGAINAFKASVVPAPEPEPEPEPEPTDTISTPTACLFFDGSGYVDCGPSDPFNTNSFTIEVKIYLNTYDGGYIMATEGDLEQTSFGYAFRISGNHQLDLTVGLDGAWINCVSGDNAINTGKWYHVAGSYDGNEIKIYIDGVLANSVSIGSTMFNPGTTNLYLGESPSFTGRNLRGKMYDVRFWNIALTEEEIADNIDVPLKGDEIGLVAAWPLWTETINLDMVDITGNYTATLNGVTWSDLEK